MPRVPRLDGPQVRTAPLPTPQVSPEAMGAPIARAVGQVGQIIEQENERVAQVQSNEALVRMRQARDRILYDRQNGVLTRKRMDAIDAPKALDDAWQKEMSAIAATIRNPTARQRFMERAAMDQAETQSVVLRHVDTEMERVDADTASDLLTGLGNKVADSAGVAEVTDAAIAEAESVARARFDRMGLSPESVEVRTQQLVSGLRKREVQSLLAAENIDGAEATFERIRDQLTPDDREQVQKAMETQGTAVRSQAIAGDVFARFKTEAEALAAVRESHSGALEDAAVSRVKVLFGERDSQIRADVELAADRAYNAALEGREPSAEDRALLSEFRPQVLRTMMSVREQASKGEPIQTDWAEWDKLTQMPNAQFRDINLAEYRNVLADAEYKDLANRQMTLRGTGGRGAESVLSPLQTTSEVFRAVVERKLLANAKVRTMADFKKYKDANERFTQINADVQAELRARAANTTGPLRASETRDAINTVLDRYELDGSDLVRRVPEVVSFTLSPVATDQPRMSYPSPKPNMTREAYFDLLMQGGEMNRETAKAIVLREIP